MWILRIEYDALHVPLTRRRRNILARKLQMFDQVAFILLFQATFRIWRKPSRRMWRLLSMLWATHIWQRPVGFCSFPLLSVLLLLGNVKLGLAIILPILLGFGLLCVEKPFQIRESFKHIIQKLRDNSESFGGHCNQRKSKVWLDSEDSGELFIKDGRSEKIPSSCEFQQAFYVVFRMSFCEFCLCDCNPDRCSNAYRRDRYHTCTFWNMYWPPLRWGRV